MRGRRYRRVRLREWWRRRRRGRGQGGLCSDPRHSEGRGWHVLDPDRRSHHHCSSAASSSIATGEPMAFLPPFPSSPLPPHHRPLPQSKPPTLDPIQRHETPSAPLSSLLHTSNRARALSPDNATRPPRNAHSGISLPPSPILSNLIQPTHSQQEPLVPAPPPPPSSQQATPAAPPSNRNPTPPPKPVLATIRPAAQTRDIPIAVRERETRAVGDGIVYT